MANNAMTKRRPRDGRNCGGTLFATGGSTAQHTQDGTPRRGGIDLTDANRSQKAEAKGEEDGGGIERQERDGEKKES